MLKANVRGYFVDIKNRNMPVGRRKKICYYRAVMHIYFRGGGVTVQRACYAGTLRNKLKIQRMGTGANKTVECRRLIVKNGS